MPNIFQDISKKISDDITVDSNKKIQLRDTGIYLQSSADGTLSLVSDSKILLTGSGTGTDDIKLDGTVTIDEGLYNTQVSITSDTTLGNNVSYIDVDGSSASGSSIVVSIAAPAVGRRLMISNTTGNGTANIVLNSGTWDGTNGTAVLTTGTQLLEVFGVSTSRFMIVENVGSVAFPD
jgi:hypothetical protein